MALWHWKQQGKEEQEEGGGGRAREGRKKEKSFASRPNLLENTAHAHDPEHGDDGSDVALHASALADNPSDAGHDDQEIKLVPPKVEIVFYPVPDHLDHHFNAVDHREHDVGPVQRRLVPGMFISVVRGHDQHVQDDEEHDYGVELVIAEGKRGRTNSVS